MTVLLQRAQYNNYVGSTNIYLDKTFPISLRSMSIKETSDTAGPLPQDTEFYSGVSKFNFPNGDSYEGGFCAHVSGLVWRQGIGTYTTKCGQFYRGEWDADKLLENVDAEITYPDGAKYMGKLLNGKYSGPGIYQLEENMSIICNFAENQPVGSIAMVDPNGIIWHGNAAPGSDSCLLLPEHSFYGSLTHDRGKGKPKAGSDQRFTDEQKNAGSSESSPEEEVSTLTRADSKMDFEESSWYQTYADFKNKYEPIVIKVKEQGIESISSEERIWYDKYKAFEKKYTTIINDFKAKRESGAQCASNLFEMINSQENQSEKIFVLYPQKDADG
ncbi:uncharacterized protein LOC132699615 [Cylas formicarius]|uniref:uncharacterized protein LOC132699615 n=1 Tax=Cylas formicarius TaxID=197179 RepID=UPI002958CCB1|nr:uncharacterized protein LOC132699615 [Cylas formicarius]